MTDKPLEMSLDLTIRMYIGGQALNEVTEHKDLSVVFDHELKFTHKCLQ